MLHICYVTANSYITNHINMLTLHIVIILLIHKYDSGLLGVVLNVVLYFFLFYAFRRRLEAQVSAEEDNRQNANKTKR